MNVKYKINYIYLKNLKSQKKKREIYFRALHVFYDDKWFFLANLLNFEKKKK